MSFAMNLALQVDFQVIDDLVSYLGGVRTPKAACTLWIGTICAFGPTHLCAFCRITAERRHDEFESLYWATWANVST
jgi:hypothetical protein